MWELFIIYVENVLNPNIIVSINPQHFIGFYYFMMDEQHCTKYSTSLHLKNLYMVAFLGLLLISYHFLFPILLFFSCTLHLNIFYGRSQFLQSSDSIISDWMRRGMLSRGKVDEWRAVKISITEFNQTFFGRVKIHTYLTPLYQVMFDYILRAFWVSFAFCVKVHVILSSLVWCLYSDIINRVFLPTLMQLQRSARLVFHTEPSFLQRHLYISYFF